MIITSLDQFIEQANERNYHGHVSARGNAWIENHTGKFYMRAGPRMIDGDLKRMLTISNVVVERHQRQKGHYRRFLASCEEAASLHGFAGVYVENVLLPSQFGIYERRGYTMVPVTADLLDIGFGPRSWYKLTT